MSLLNGKLIEDGSIQAAKVDSADFVLESQRDTANGFAGLDGAGKILSSILPTEVVEYKGAWNANTNTPTLIDGTGDAGDQYRVSTAGTQDLGSGSITFAIGDLVLYNGSIWEVIPQGSSFSGKDTDDLPEGSTNFYYTEGRFDTSFSGKSTTDLSEGTNLYFTEVRVEDTTLANYVVGANAAVANTDDVKGAVGKLQGQIDSLVSGGLQREVESFVLDATDIGNQFITLSNSPANSSVSLSFGGLIQKFGTDYSVVGAQVNFLGDIGSLAAIGDEIEVSYSF